MVHRIGIIGLGSIGQRMLAAIAEHDAFEASVAWDPSPAACARTRAGATQVHVAEDADSVFGDRRVDVVYVACPPRFHRRYALAAIDVDKPILCEKPLGVDLDESRELVERVEASGVANAVNLLFGCARNAATIATALADGGVGDVAWIEIRLHLPRWAAKRFAEAPWLGERAQGGFVREVGTHYVYLCRRLLGPLAVRHVALRYPEDGIAAERFAAISLEGAGVPITIAGTTEGAGPERNEMTVWGSRTSYRTRDLHLLDVADGERWVAAYPPPENPERETHLRQLDGLARLLEHGEPALPDFRAALEVQETVEAILASPS